MCKSPVAHYLPFVEHLKLAKEKRKEKKNIRGRFSSRAMSSLSVQSSSRKMYRRGSELIKWLMLLNQPKMDREEGSVQLYLSVICLLGLRFCFWVRPTLSFFPASTTVTTRKEVVMLSLLSHRNKVKYSRVWIISLSDVQNQRGVLSWV